MCPHGMNIPSVFISIESQHTVQHGGSVFPLGNFLQCFCAISTSGSLSTASFFAFWDLYWRAASSSLILLIISNKSSEAKFWLKLFMNELGSKLLYDACILAKSRPLNTFRKLLNKSFTMLSMCSPTCSGDLYWFGFVELDDPFGYSFWLLCIITNWGAGICMPPTLTFCRPDGPALDWVSASGWPSGTPILSMVNTFPFCVRIVVDLALIPPMLSLTSSLMFGLVAAPSESPL